MAEAQRWCGLLSVDLVGRPDTTNKIQTQLWGTMNDDQRVWIIGSFLHFACNEGFTELKGYDLSEADAKGMMAGACLWWCICH